jgi:hypothetical protein
MSDMAIFHQQWHWEKSLTVRYQDWMLTEFFLLTGSRRMDEAVNALG